MICYHLKLKFKRSFIKIFHTFVVSLVAVHCLFPGGFYITDWAAVGKVCCPLDSILLPLHIFSSFVSLVLECIWTDFEDPFHWRDEVYGHSFLWSLLLQQCSLWIGRIFFCSNLSGMVWPSDSQWTSLAPHSNPRHFLPLF